MSDKAPKFTIFRNMKNGYKWRLRSATGETVERSERGHRNKGSCQQEVQRLKGDRYRDAQVRDATIG